MNIKIRQITLATAAKALVALAGFAFAAQAQANDCERPFTLDETVAIAQSFNGAVSIAECKSNFGGVESDNTELAAAEIMGMLGIYTVACGRPAGANSVAEMISHIVSQAVEDGGNASETSFREVVAVRVYECGANNR